MFRFEKLEVWQRAVDLAGEVYSLTRAFPDDEGGGFREIIQHPHGQRFAGARQLPENFRQLEPERIVDQGERDRKHAVRLQKPEGFGDSFTRIDI